MMGVRVTSLLLILGVFCSASWADHCADTVMERYHECLAPGKAAFGGMNGSELNNLLANTDLRVTCGLVTAVMDCVLHTFTECQELASLIPDVMDGLRMINDAINYVCVDHIDVFNRNKACLLRTSCETSEDPQIIVDAGAQCQTPHRGDMFLSCVPASFPDCLAGIVQRQCGARIADAMRGLFQQIAANYGICDGRRRFKLMMKKKEMKKKELFSPLELMHKTFPSLF